MSCWKMKHKGLIYVQTSIDMEIHLDIVKILFKDQKVDMLQFKPKSLVKRRN